MKFSIKDFFSKCDQICSFLRIWSHLLKKSLMENFIFCAVLEQATALLDLASHMKRFPSQLLKLSIHKRVKKKKTLEENFILLLNVCHHYLSPTTVLIWCWVLFFDLFLRICTLTDSDLQLVTLFW